MQRGMLRDKHAPFCMHLYATSYSIEILTVHISIEQLLFHRARLPGGRKQPVNRAGIILRGHFRVLVDFFHAAAVRCGIKE